MVLGVAGAIPKERDGSVVALLGFGIIGTMVLFVLAIGLIVVRAGLKHERPLLRVEIRFTPWFRLIVDFDESPGNSRPGFRVRACRPDGTQRNQSRLDS